MPPEEEALQAALAEESAAMGAAGIGDPTTQPAEVEAQAPDPGEAPASENTPAEDEPQAPAGNPAWEEAWADVPEEIKERQRAIFQRWDTDRQHLNAKYEPYAQFEQQGYDPQYIAAAVQLQSQLLENPRDFWERMAKHWGFDSAADAQAAAQGAGAGDGEEEFQTPEQRELAAIRQRLEAQDAERQRMIQEQQAEQSRQQQIARVNADIDAVEAKYGKQNRDALIERALFNASLGRNPSIENAYFELKKQRDELEAEVAKKYAPKAAPQVLGTGPSTPVGAPPVPKGIPTDDELLAQAMAAAQEFIGR